MKKNSHIYSLDANTRKMIATLMYELGLGLNASYSVDGTGCYNSDITSYLSKIIIIIRVLMITIYLA